LESEAVVHHPGDRNITMLHVARKAFVPARLPFSLPHIDSGYNSPEVLVHRDALPSLYFAQRRKVFERDGMGVRPPAGRRC
jgi:sulfate adenylyltransferase subunit 2